MSSQSGSLAALKAAADAAEAVETACTSRTSLPGVKQGAKLDVIVPPAAIRPSFSGHQDAIHLATASFLDREQQQRSGIAGFHSDVSNACVKLINLNKTKSKDMGNTKRTESSPTQTLADTVGNDTYANELIDTTWSQGKNDIVVSMPPKDSYINKEAAESLLALSLSGCGSRDSFS